MTREKAVKMANLYDHEFPNNHQRASIGVEIKSSPIEINSNFTSV